MIKVTIKGLPTFNFAFMGVIESSPSAGISPPVASSEENRMTEEFSWIKHEDADIGTKEDFIKQSEGIRQDCESSGNAALVQADRGGTSEDQEPNGIPEIEEEQKIKLTKSKQSGKKIRKEVVDKQTKQLNEERHEDYGQLRENQRREKQKKEREDHLRKQQQRLQKKRIVGSEENRPIQQQQEEVLRKGYVVMRRKAEEKRAVEQEKAFAEQRLIKQQQLFIEFQEFKLIRPEPSVERKEQQEEEKERDEQRRREQQQQEEKERKERAEKIRNQQQQQQQQQQHQDEWERKKHKEQIRKQQQQPEEDKGRMEPEEQEEKEVQQQYNEKGRRESVEQGRNYVQQHVEGQQDVELQLQIVLRQKQKLEEELKIMKLNEKQSIELKEHVDLQEKMEVCLLWLKERIKIIEQQHQKEQLSLNEELQKEREQIIKVQGRTEQLVKVEKGKENAKCTAVKEEEKNINFNCETFGSTIHEKDVAKSWTSSASSPDIQLQSPSNVCKGQMSNIEDITCTDLEEYDRNLNHCKNCRRRQNTTDFDDIREEGHISHSQSFEGEEYDRHSNHMYSKHRRRRRNTTDGDGEFVEGQISRSESFPELFYDITGRNLTRQTSSPGRSHRNSCSMHRGRPNMKPKKDDVLSDGDDGFDSIKHDDKHVQHVTNTTRLSPREIEKASRKISKEWHSLGGLLNIEQHKMDNILQRFDLRNVTEKAVRVLQVYNQRANFTREELGACLEEVNLTELKDKIIKGELRALK